MTIGTHIGRDYRLTVDGEFRPHSVAINDENRRARAFAYLEKKWRKRTNRASLTAFASWTMGALVVWGITTMLIMGY